MSCDDKKPHRAAHGQRSPAGEERRGNWIRPRRADGAIHAGRAPRHKGPGDGDDAPKRKKAYYAGANHCAPHRFNDLWQYDLASNTWSLLYYPDFDGCIRNEAEMTAALDKHCVVKDEVLQTTRSGMCVPAHLWWGFTYDDTADRVLWMAPWANVEINYLKNKGLLDQVVNDNLPPLWAFDPGSKHWSLVRTTGTTPKATEASSLEYVSALGVSVWYASNWKGTGMWAYDSKTQTWEQWLGQDDTYFNSEAPGGESVMNYDEVHHVLVAARSSTIFTYDFAKNEWSRAKTGLFEDAHDSHTAFAYYTQNLVLKNNIFYTPDTGITVYLYYVKGAKVYNNIIWGTQGSKYGGLAISPEMTNLELKNNIILNINYDHLGATFDAAQHKIDYNVFGVLDASQYTAAAHDIVGDPQFTVIPLSSDMTDHKTSTLVASDFHLKPTSPAIDKGLGLPGVVDVDFDGVARPKDGDGSGGAQWDIGAFEYVP